MLVLFALLVVWATDIGAYFAGRRIGGAKLAPAISPNKTWAGLGGGIVAAAIAGGACSTFTPYPPSLIAGMDVGIALAIIAQGGDLFESWLKRRVGAKDSGALIPGHGGLLDRIDGLTFTLPVFALLVYLSGHHVMSVTPSAMAIQTCPPPATKIRHAAGIAPAPSARIRLKSSPRIRSVLSLRRITAGDNVALLAEQARQFRPKRAVIANPSLYNELKEALQGTGVEVAAGEDAVLEAAAMSSDIVMSAIVGAAGLKPTLAAIRAGGTVALANKECLVCAGQLMMKEVRAHNATLIPVDSEHNAIFQLFDFDHPEFVETVTITASGGPFRTWTTEQMKHATPEQAIKHPNWNMGAKISVDSATMMNKGLELIEAAALFPLKPEQLDVLIHPQSVLHCLVRMVDGSVLAQMSLPDMCTPIAYALAWPERMEAPVGRLDLAAIGSLQFEAPDLERFPALRLAREALAEGGNAPTVLNAANEIAVGRFLKKDIGFLDIVKIVEKTLASIENAPLETIDDVLACDARARRFAEDIINGYFGAFAAHAVVVFRRAVRHRIHPCIRALYRRQTMRR